MMSHEQMSHEQAWEVYVGAQGPEEFLLLSDAASPEEALDDYLAESEVFRGADLDEQRRARQLLLEYLGGAGVERDELRDLMRAAASHGDVDQVQICRQALEGDRLALVICSQVLAATRGEQ